MNRLFKRSKEYASLLELIKSKTYPISAFGFTDAAFIHHSVALAEDVGSLLIVMETDSEAKRVYDVIREEYQDSGLLRTPEINFFDEYSHSNHLEIERLETIFASLEKEKFIIVSSVTALMAPMSEPEYMMLLDLDLQEGFDYEFETVIESLQSMGYERMDIVEAKGQFSVKGGILDVFPILYDLPVRLDFFGDELYAIKTFDIATQRSADELGSVVIKPCREAIVSPQKKEDAIERVSAMLKSCKGEKDENRKTLLLRTLEQLKGEIDTHYPAKLLPFVSDEPHSLFDYVGDFQILLSSQNRTLAKAEQVTNDAELRYREDLLEGRLLAEQTSLFMSFAGFLEKLSFANTISFNTLKTSLKHLKAKSLVDYHFMEPNKYFGDLTSLAFDLKKRVESGYLIVIAVNEDNQLDSIQRILDDADMSYTICDSLDALESDKLKPSIYLLEFPILNGFLTDSFKTLLLSPAELFGKRAVKKKRAPQSSKKIKAFSEIEVGDYVVHESYGIGRYCGIFLTEAGGEERDMIKVEYSGNSVLYVPVERLETLHKYIGKDAAVVSLHSMGSQKWSKQKERARAAVEEIADELVDLYAKRRQTKGHAFPPDDVWQTEFEELFPYSETEGQLVSSSEIKNDMQRDFPMERLLCGDVGYGKTEVALRAIFKCVTNGKQACVLVPTTILAEQHYISMSHRLSTFPIQVGVLNRFKTKKEQRELIENLRTGRVDLIIGTHRLLSKDVAFKDLGLLVVDEEQRFGVAHKEKIKNLKLNVHSLSMTATPIPRTLNMSLIGVKDLSLIENPPEDRFPIQTYVLEDDDMIIKEAIEREVSRGGQVYFVHNRVQDIDSVAFRLRQLCPDISFAIAHGQLKEREIEPIIMDFMNGDYDALITTTIIETGVDIPNVNTIIIDNCDHFGLSQLYQLRGRVGRSNRLAYAYLCYKKGKVLSEDSEKRLQAIKEFSSLGSGFKLSMRDLEIRGSGNVFGMAQSGHIANIGYEMYAKLLEDAIMELKGETVNKTRDCKVEFATSSFISEHYIGDYRFRLEMYKAISAIRNFEDREDVVSEMQDRFGDVPQETLNLSYISLIRRMASDLDFELVIQKQDVVELHYYSDSDLDLNFVYDTLKQYDDDRLRFVAEEKPYFVLDESAQTGDVLYIMEDVLEFLRVCLAGKLEDISS